MRNEIRRRGFRTTADRTLAQALRLGDHPPPAFGRPAATTLTRSPRGKAIELHVFPGRSSRRALVIGGVHGSESIGVEVTRALLAELDGWHRRPFFTAIVVPALFPDNLPESHGGDGPGRRATRRRVDPNRQFPAVGRGLDAGDDARNGYSGASRDAHGRSIESANIALIELIRQFRPRRIASVHAIRRATSAGIYADPHRKSGSALGDEAADLAQRMHAIARSAGGHVPGSAGGSGAYPHQRDVARDGVSLGEWASQAVTTGAYRRSALPVITLELKRDWSPTAAGRRRRDVAAFARAIRLGFLEP